MWSVDLKPCEIPQDLKAQNLAGIFTYMWENNFSYDAHNGRKAHGNSAQSCWPTTIDGRAKILGMSAVTYKKIHVGDSTVSKESVRRVARHLLSELEEGSPLWQEWLKLISSKYDELKVYEQDSTSAIEDEADAALLPHRLQPTHGDQDSHFALSRKMKLPVISMFVMIFFGLVFYVALNHSSFGGDGFSGDDGGGDGGCCSNSGFASGNGGSGGGTIGPGCCDDPASASRSSFGGEGDDDDGTNLSLLFLEGAEHGTFRLINTGSDPIQMTEAVIIWCRKDVLGTDQGCWDVPVEASYSERRFKPIDPQLTYVEPGDGKFIKFTDTLIEDITWKGDEVISDDGYIWKSAMPHAIVDHHDEHKCHVTVFFTEFYESSDPQPQQTGLRSLDCSLLKGFAKSLLQEH